jgi:hypothetical protein
MRELTASDVVPLSSLLDLYALSADAQELIFEDAYLAPV